MSFLVIPASYLIGAIPVGYLVGKIGYGLDIRQHGSGNIGSTNVHRVLGAKAATLVLTLDIFKGALAVAGSTWLVNGTFSFPAKSGSGGYFLIIVVAMAAILGNMFSVFIKGRGGKGVGVATGVLLFMVPEIMLILLAVWLIVTLTTKYVSLGSLTIAALFPILVLIFHRQNTAYLIFAVVASVLVFFSHRTNVKRLMEGTELRSNRKKEENIG